MNVCLTFTILFGLVISQAYSRGLRQLEDPLSVQETRKMNDNDDDFEEDFDASRKQKSSGNPEEKSNEFEGDIIPDGYVRGVSHSDSKKRSLLYKRGYLMAWTQSRKWTGGKVYFVFQRSLAREIRARVIRAIRYIQSKTCIRFFYGRHRNGYILIRPSKGCSSHVGRTGKLPQPLNLSIRCKTGSVVHEFLHALGFFHEQSRRDRDSYVTIQYKNIKEKKKRNFKKYTHVLDEKYRSPYDYGSIMHYSRKAFSKNGKETIVPEDSNAHIGQRRALSAIDITEINQFYGCGCSDSPKYSSECPKWAKYFCFKYEDFMRRSCKKSCGFC